MLPDDDKRHGTYAGAVAHWKYKVPLCGPCETAGRRTDKAIRYDAHRGMQRTVTLGERAWNVLHATPRDQLKRATGIRVDKIIRLDQGGPKAKVYRTTRDRILAAETLPFWTAVGIQRRIRALTARGWSMSALAAETGLDVDGLKRFRSREEPQFARREFALPLLDAYTRLHMTTPEGRGATRARNEAAAKGWAQPFAWDRIDDPNEQPKGQVRADDFVDPHVVLRILSGDNKVKTTMAEKHAVTAAWQESGRSLKSLENLTGWRTDRYKVSA